jgi:hypothetical protein
VFRVTIATSVAPQKERVQASFFAEFQPDSYVALDTSIGHAICRPEGGMTCRTVPLEIGMLEHTADIRFAGLSVKRSRAEDRIAAQPSNYSDKCGRDHRGRDTGASQAT